MTWPVVTSPDNEATWSVVVPLALLQASLGIVMICLLVFCLLPYGMLIALVAAVIVHGVGFASTLALSSFSPRLMLLWALSFTLAPLAVMPFAAYEHYTNEASTALAFWIAFTFSLLAAGFLGGALGVRGFSRRSITGI